VSGLAYGSRSEPVRELVCALRDVRFPRVHTVWSLLAEVGKLILSLSVLLLGRRILAPTLRRMTPKSACVRRAGRAAIFAVLIALCWALAVVVLRDPFADDPSHHTTYGIAGFLLVCGAALACFSAMAWKKDAGA
jgi:formate hydrogenlyase subunit 3/multisubunit Na+/H+ antiporter MnhD subunit